jgi:hypothetical protein
MSFIVHNTKSHNMANLTSNPTSFEARIVAANREAREKYSDHARRYEALQGYDLRFEEDLELELEQHQAEIERVKNQALVFDQALDDIQVSARELEGRQQEFSRVLEDSKDDNLEHVAQKLRELFEKLPELKLFLAEESREIVDDYKKAMPKISDALARLQTMDEEFHELQNALLDLFETKHLKISQLGEATRQEFAELGEKILRAEEYRVEWNSIHVDLSDELSRAKLIAQESHDEKVRWMGQTARRGILLKYYQAIVFGSAPEQDINPVVEVVEELRKLNLVPQGELLTLDGVGNGTMNSFEIAATALFNGVEQMDLGDIYDFEMTDLPFFLGFCLAALDKGVPSLGMSESLAVLRVAEILMLHLRLTKYQHPLQRILGKLQPSLCSSKLVGALYAWVVRTERPTEVLSQLESIKVGDMGLLIDKGWMLIFDLSITVAGPEHYRFVVSPKGFTLFIDDYRGKPWSHMWTVREVIQMKGAFERIFPQPSRKK